MNWSKLASISAWQLDPARLYYYANRWICTLLDFSLRPLLHFFIEMCAAHRICITSPVCSLTSQEGAPAGARFRLSPRPLAQKKRKRSCTRQAAAWAADFVCCAIACSSSSKAERSGRARETVPLPLRSPLLAHPTPPPAVAITLSSAVAVRRALLCPRLDRLFSSSCSSSLQIADRERGPRGRSFAHQQWR
jgi:hypothetical protein